MPQMAKRFKRLQEAESREDMKQIAAYVPAEMHRRLVQLRVDENIAVGEAVRSALTAWFASRGRRKAGRA
jgi:hypothetical protein